MPLKTRRQSRYTKLINSGFLPFEARPLSKVPTRTCPYMKNIVMTRLGILGRAKTAKVTRAEYEDRIRELYDRNGWIRKNKKGQLVGDPWQMLRDYEDEYRAKFPSYTSPSDESHKDWKDFYQKLERTLEKQRGKPL